MKYSNKSAFTLKKRFFLLKGVTGTDCQNSLNSTKRVSNYCCRINKLDENSFQFCLGTASWLQLKIFHSVRKPNVQSTATCYSRCFVEAEQGTGRCRPSLRNHLQTCMFVACLFCAGSLLPAWVHKAIITFTYFRRSRTGILKCFFKSSKLFRFRARRKSYETVVPFDSAKFSRGQGSESRRQTHVNAHIRTSSNKKVLPFIRIKWATQTWAVLVL